jgi:hypothetical protein
MSRKLKVLGVAFTVAMAFSAVMAAAASAVFHSEVEHTIITGSQTTRNSFTVNAGTTHCETATFEGTLSAKTTDEATVTPTYSNCKLTAFGGETLNATVDVNNCHYLITTDGVVHLTCGGATGTAGAGTSIQVTAPFCTVTVAPQTINKVDFVNVGEGTTREIDVVATGAKIKYTQSAFCPTGGGTFENGTYIGTVRVTGENTAKEHVGIWHE